ncbi:hypothetical protein RJ641_033807 [Dillenia turbinata]|uniref:DNA-directed primase/polymerase protein n=1 Tax=Dillenia turbinata TaxID=194707 RepID=A0AAN8W0C4_9MAGN
MAMDDVDRLFRCFKCGISPPQSAMRERKAKRKKSNQASMESPTSNILSPCSGESQKKKSKIQLETEREEKGSTVLKRRRQISPIIFYGSPHGVPPKRPSSMLRLLREIQIEIHKEHKSNLRKEVWSTFPRQDEAMKLVKGHSAVHVFSYQDHFSGQRRFLVSTYKEFWKRYKQMDSKLRHHYEVIQEVNI